MTKHATISDLKARAAVTEEIRFRQAIPQSNIAVARVLSWLYLSIASSGWWLLSRPARARLARGILNGENDEADIFMSREPTIVGARLVEVKHRKTLDFTCVDDFPHETIFCDRINKPRRADHFFLVNRALAHAACVVAKRAQFQTNQTYDQGKAGGAYTVSAVQKNGEGILWISLDRPLHLVPA
jgi:hypothetical protein